MGIAIKLVTKNFASKNLGSVTFSPSYEVMANSVATAYCTAIGDDTNQDKIYDFVVDLMYKDLWDKCYAIYPILGNTLAKQIINLKNPSSSSLILSANASAGTDKLVFSNSGAVDAITPVGISELTDNFSAYGIVMRTGSTNGSGLFYFGTSENRAVCNTAAGTGGTNFRYVYNNVGTVTSLTFDTAFSFSAIKKQGERSVLMTDGVLAAEGSIMLDSQISPNLILGRSDVVAKDAGAGTSTLWNGDVYFYSLGSLSKTESSLFDSCVKTFVVATKGMTF